MQGLVNQLGQPLIVNRVWLVRTHFVIERVMRSIRESDTSLAYRGTRELQIYAEMAPLVKPS